MENSSFSIFLLEEVVYDFHPVCGISDGATKSCFKHVTTCPTLEEARKTQKAVNQKTIILPTY